MATGSPTDSAPDFTTAGIISRPVPDRCRIFPVEPEKDGSTEHPAPRPRWEAGARIAASASAFGAEPACLAGPPTGTRQ